MDTVSSVVIVLVVGQVKDAVRLQSIRVMVEALLEVFGSVPTLNFTSCEFVTMTHATLCMCARSRLVFIDTCALHVHVPRPHQVVAFAYR